MTNLQIIEKLKECNVDAEVIEIISKKITKPQTELSEKAKLVISFLESHKNDYKLAAEISSGTGIPSNSITGVLTGLVNKDLVEKISGDDGKKLYKIK